MAYAECFSIMIDGEHPPSDRLVEVDRSDARGIPGNSNVLGWILGHKPTSWEAHVRKEVAALASK